MNYMINWHCLLPINNEEHIKIYFCGGVNKLLSESALPQQIFSTTLQAQVARSAADNHLFDDVWFVIFDENCVFRWASSEWVRLVHQWSEIVHSLQSDDDHQPDLSGAGVSVMQGWECCWLEWSWSLSPHCQHWSNSHSGRVSNYFF